MPSLEGVGLRAPLGAKKFDVFCLFISLSIMIFNDKVCESPSMGGNNLDIIGKGRFVVVHPRSTLSL